MWLWGEKKYVKKGENEIFIIIFFIVLCLAFTLIFVSIIVARLISLLFGHSIDQFYISGSPSFTSALLSPWFILLFAPVVEELAWHTYGTDALRQRFNLFTTCMIFSLYWAFWHLPLSFIDGYYHSNVVEEGFLYSLNYVFSLFVFVILMNWLYYKTNRNIFITIIFHCSANVTNEIFATHPDSKVIQTVLLLIITIVLLLKEKEMFFRKEFWLKLTIDWWNPHVLYTQTRNEYNYQSCVVPSDR